MSDGMDFVTAVWTCARRVGMKPPLVANAIIRELFPRTDDASHEEGADNMFRRGVVEAVRQELKRQPAAPSQTDFGSIDPAFSTVASKLKHYAYYVEKREALLPVAELIASPDLLDDARKYLRRKGMETLEEADRLDELYEAVTAPSLG